MQHSLLSLCIQNISNNIDDHIQNLQILPAQIKNRLLRYLTMKISRCNMKKVCEKLVHAKTEILEFPYVEIDEEYLILFSICHKLKSLRLYKYGDLSLLSTGLDVILPNFKNLFIFQAINCPAITDDIIKVIAKNLLYLRVLDISGCVNITDTALEDISEMRCLRALNLDRTEITNDSMRTLANGRNANNLAELRIAECKNITYESVRIICEKCMNLEIFLFHNCAHSRDSSLIAEALDASVNLRNLKQLTWTIFVSAQVPILQEIC